MIDSDKHIEKLVDEIDRLSEEVEHLKYELKDYKYALRDLLNEHEQTKTRLGEVKLEAARLRVKLRDALLTKEILYNNF